MPADNLPRIAFIGFGEAGQALASGLQEAGITNEAAWDILFPEPEGERLRQAAARLHVRQAASAADALADADIVIAAVTAASSLEAARAAKPHLRADQFYLDINSVSPGRKQETARLLEGAARYVDVAVMAPVNPARHKTPMLLAGDNAEDLEPMLRGLQMNTAIAGPEIGSAAAIKMVRSVMIKGLEALMPGMLPRRGARRRRTADRRDLVADLSRRRLAVGGGATTSNAWQATVRAAGMRWKRSPIPCANSASSR